MGVNDDAGILNARGALWFFASVLAPTGGRSGTNRRSVAPTGMMFVHMFLWRLRTSFITTTKNTGTNTTARVALIIPPITPVPMAC